MENHSKTFLVPHMHGSFLSRSHILQKHNHESHQLLQKVVDKINTPENSKNKTNKYTIFFKNNQRRIE